jgi:hypothetical protein
MDFTKVYRQASGTWTDENNRPLACELEYGTVETHGVALWVNQGSPLLEFINDAIGHIVEGGIFIQIRNRGLYQMNIDSKFNSPTFDDTYSAISIRHLLTVFYLLLLGYVLAFACVVTEYFWHLCRSKGTGPTTTCYDADKHK